MMADAAPLIVHVIHNFAIGGVENGLVNLINHLPAERYRHAIVCMQDYSDFRYRVRRSDVAVHAMYKRELRLPQLYARLFEMFRKLRPAIVHSRNLSGLDSLLPSFAAGVAVRLHGEHGRDVDDPYGENRKLRWMRRLHRPLVSRYVCVSNDLKRYLVHDIGVPDRRVLQIYNGVDIDKFRPVAPALRALPGAPWGSAKRFVLGTVGRLQPVKNQLALLQAYRAMIEHNPSVRHDAGIVIVGDGPERQALCEYVSALQLEDCVWMAGARDDVQALLPNLDVFVLPSIAEGISNTILEAMACGVPIVATAVGGNPEIVADGVSGRLVPSANVGALAGAVEEMYTNREFATRCGVQARAHAQTKFSLSTMVDAYDALYMAALESRSDRLARVA